MSGCTQGHLSRYNARLGRPALPRLGDSLGLAFQIVSGASPCKFYAMQVNLKTLLIVKDQHRGDPFLSHPSITSRTFVPMPSSVPRRDTRFLECLSPGAMGVWSYGALIELSLIYPEISYRKY